MERIQEAMEYARQVFQGDSSGHDYHHTLRVYHLATSIAREEGADLETVQLAALLHDVDDHKLSPQTCENQDRAAAFLKSHGVSDAQTEEIVKIISGISFSRNSGRPDSLEGMCVQDADRLDAIGAIGIARTFAYGGSHGRAIHDPEGNDETTSIAHFYDKLLKLKALMNTESGRAIAEGRDRFMRQFLEEFHAEWDGVRQVDPANKYQLHNATLCPLSSLSRQKGGNSYENAACSSKAGLQGALGRCKGQTVLAGTLVRKILSLSATLERSETLSR